MQHYYLNTLLTNPFEIVQEPPQWKAYPLIIAVQETRLLWKALPASSMHPHLPYMSMRLLLTKTLDMQLVWMIRSWGYSLDISLPLWKWHRLASYLLLHLSNFCLLHSDPACISHVPVPRYTTQCEGILSNALQALFIFPHRYCTQFEWLFISKPALFWCWHCIQKIRNQ